MHVSPTVFYSRFLILNDSKWPLDCFHILGFQSYSFEFKNTSDQLLSFTYIIVSKLQNKVQCNKQPLTYLNHLPYLQVL